jgi:hypothetical protein
LFFLAGDTLAVRRSTGTAGWDLRLIAAPGAADGLFVGEGLYLTDVVVRDTLVWRPPRVAVRAKRESCERHAG